MLLHHNNSLIIRNSIKIKKTIIAFLKNSKMSLIDIILKILYTLAEKKYDKLRI